jgi:photosynthetic reaction center cytochrome c subunit
MKIGKHKILALVALGAVTLTSGCDYVENLPFEVPWGHRSEELGAPGLGMQWIKNRGHWRALVAANSDVPEPQPPASADGPAASTIYQNVPVLGHLSIGQFNRLMVAMTEWVAPDEGCTYCHLPDSMAAEGPYTKLVARKMIEMTIRANEGWQKHVADTGVTCYTCHRGQPVPDYTWSKIQDRTIPSKMVDIKQNLPSWNTAMHALPYNPMELFLEGDQDIRVTGPEALPINRRRVMTKQGEETFALMNYISKSLGVGCVYCHDARAFERWDFSRPARVTAFYAIRHVREMNLDYINPLLPIMPEDRKGPTGDMIKVGCATCHQEVYKPLFGAKMLADYPELATSGKSAEAESVAESEEVNADAGLVETAQVME